MTSQILTLKLRQSTRLFYLFHNCFCPQSKSSPYTSHSSCYCRTHDCFLLISFKSWFNILRKRNSSLCTLGHSDLPGKTMFLIWLFLKFLRNDLNTQEPGREKFSSQKSSRGNTLSDSPRKNVLSKLCHDYFLFLNFKKVCGENVIPYYSSFEIFAHTGISVLSFVIQMMGLRAEMERNKVKNSKNVKEMLFFSLLTI